MKGEHIISRKAATLMAVVIATLFFGAMGVNAADTYDEGMDAGLLAFGVGTMVCAVVFFIIWLLLAIWAYKDAKKRCMSSPIIWFLVVFFLGIIGLIIYVVIRKDECQKQQAAMNMPPPPPPQ